MTGHKLIFVALCVFVLLLFSVFKLHFFLFQATEANQNRLLMVITEFLQV